MKDGDASVHQIICHGVFVLFNGHGTIADAAICSSGKLQIYDFPGAIPQLFLLKMTGVFETGWRGWQAAHLQRLHRLFVGPVYFGAQQAVGDHIYKE